MIRVRKAAANTGAVLEGRGGFVVIAVWGHMGGYFSSAFSSKMGLESFTHSFRRFEILSLPPPKKRLHCAGLDVFVPSSVI